MAWTLAPERYDLTRTNGPWLRRHIWKTTAGLALLCELLLCWTFQRPWFMGNLGVVDPGRVLRSAQPTTQLSTWIRHFQVSSVLNLRGGSPADWWYDAEVKTTRASGVRFYDFPLSATKRPSRRELLVLIDLLRSCPYPLLIHCKSGADRTGLASALYRMVLLGESPERAESSFSVEFGHIPIGGPEHLHEPLDEYAAWLKANRLPHTPERFREWVKNDYRSADCPVDPPPWPPGPRPRRS